MAKKYKYYFNPTSLTYVRHNQGWLQRFLLLTGALASVLLSGILIYSIYIYQHKSPGEKRLLKEVALYKQELNSLNSRYNDLCFSLRELRKKDKEIYRVVFEAEPLPDEESGFNFELAGKNHASLQNASQLNAKFAILTERLNVMTQSYTALLQLARQKQRLLASVPAIQPVAYKDLREIASGFGMRLHPIYKVPRMHEGLDFAAAKGTEVYVTGDGIVEKVDFDGNGLGQNVVIDHGFGYKTIYGHLSKYLLRQGQHVKRGELVGFVGSTGLSTAPHLHYEVVKNGKKVNPVGFFHNDLSAGDYEKLVMSANRANQSFD